MRGEPSRADGGERLVRRGRRGARGRVAASAGRRGLERRTRWPWRRRCRARRRASSRTSKAIKREMSGVADRLRELIDLVLGSLDEPGADGARARRAGRTSRATTSTGCWPRRPASRRSRCAAGCCSSAPRGSCAAARAAADRGGRAPPATARSPRSRARSRAPTAMPPSAFAASGRPVELDAPNGIHFHPPAGLLIPGARRAAAPAATSPSAWSATTSTASRELLELAADAPGRPRSSARCGPASSPSGSRARRRARR